MADKFGDASQYLKLGPRENPVLIFHWLIQFSPVNNQSGFYFSNQQIREITFSESKKKSFYKTASSVGTGMFSSSSSMLSESGSDLMSPSIRERNKRKLHHGAYQHLFSKQYWGLSRSEQIGVVYVWGKDLDGQLGISNKANKPFEDSSDVKMRMYPRMITSLKDHVVVEISCGHSHSLAVTSEGRSFSWGNNEFNQLGIEGVDFAERPIEIKGL